MLAQTRIVVTCPVEGYAHWEFQMVSTDGLRKRVVTPARRHVLAAAGRELHVHESKRVESRGGAVG